MHKLASACIILHMRPSAGRNRWTHTSSSSPPPSRFHHEETPFGASARRIAWALIVITRVTSLCLNWGRGGNATAHIRCILPSDGEVWRGWILISHERWNGVKMRTDFIFILFFIHAAQSLISKTCIWFNPSLSQARRVARSRAETLNESDKSESTEAVYMLMWRDLLSTQCSGRGSCDRTANLAIWKIIWGPSLPVECATSSAEHKRKKRKAGDADYVCVPAAGVRAHYFHC